MRHQMKRAAAQVVWAGLAGLVFTGAALADCPEPPEPVIGLDFQSRYSADSATRSEIDADAADAVEEALRPVEDFIRDLADAATDAARDHDTAAAECVMAQMAAWGRADALSEMGSSTSALTVGARLAGFALILRQMQALAPGSVDGREAGEWLDRRIAEQIAFWETDAPDGARQGNLRAWAALAAAARSADRDGPNALRFAFWSGASVAYVLCTAKPDGSLPQEMRRGPRALQYQLHALAPLTVSALILQQAGLPIAPVCDGALDRAVGFALDDLDSGSATRAITGEEQTFFSGKDEIEEFHLAWVAAYLALDGITHGDAARQRTATFGDLNYSKLGGNQTQMWAGAGN